MWKILNILSPLLFIIYVADLELWLKYIYATTYVDDTSTSVSHKLLAKVKQMLEEAALNVLKFMASNGLVANASKTVLLFLNFYLRISTIPCEYYLQYLYYWPSIECWGLNGCCNFGGRKICTLGTKT